ncbi:NAD(P)H nitroreductase [Thalassotalea ganghwensis]
MNSVDLLLKRQSNPKLIAPAPNDDELNTILAAGMRVPDHGNLSPWHFTVVKESGLNTLSELFVEAVKRDGANQVKIDKTANMPFRAPMIIVVSTRYTPHEKVPFNEQLIAAGCACHAMQMACVALGYGAMWRTGELSLNTLVKDRLNIAQQDEIVGFLYIGSVETPLPEKSSKAINSHVTYLT